MTRIAIAVSSVLLASSAFATNGTNMTGLGAQSNAMGGTGVAASYGSETVISNPATIGKTTGMNMTFGGTYFIPSVTTENDINESTGENVGAVFGGGTSGNAASSSTKADSKAPDNVIPSVSVSSRINDKLTFGIGMFGTSGMGVDYREEDNLFNAQTNMQIMKFAPTLAFNTKKFGIGVSPIIQYGSLDINFKTQVRDGAGNGLYLDGAGAATPAPAAGPGVFNTPLMQTIGSGMTSDLGMGFNIGGYFNVTNDLTIGLAYLSPINMTYDGQLSTASAAFVNPQSDFTEAFDDDLEQPSEMKLGVEYQYKKFTINLDYKKVGWGSAKGYKDFGWEDQNIVSIGGKYATDKFWVGVGYNKGDNPIKTQDGTTSYKGAVLNMFNNTFFPAITESHFSFGGGYNLTKAVSLEGAVVIASEIDVEADTTAVSSGFAYGIGQQGGLPPGTQISAPSSSKTTHSQIGYSVQVKYHF